MNPSETLIDWPQLDDLIGDTTDIEQGRMLAEMWCSVREDLEVSWPALARCQNEAELRYALHGLRGVLSMWGLAAVAGRMQICETGPESQVLWQREAGELTRCLERSLAAVEQRYPDLTKK